MCSRRRAARKQDGVCVVVDEEWRANTVLCSESLLLDVGEGGRVRQSTLTEARCEYFEKRPFDLGVRIEGDFSPITAWSLPPQRVVVSFGQYCCVWGTKTFGVGARRKLGRGGAVDHVPPSCTVDL